VKLRGRRDHAAGGGSAQVLGLRGLEREPSRQDQVGRRSARARTSWLDPGSGGSGPGQSNPRVLFDLRKLSGLERTLGLRSGSRDWVKG